MNKTLTDSDVYTLIGHAELLRGRGEIDMPVWCLDLAHRIAIGIDESLAARVAEIRVKCEQPPATQQPEPRDAIARSKRILGLVDEYHENPTRDTRTALRVALMDEFQPEPRDEVTGWQPIATAPADTEVIVFWLDPESPDHPERYDFDMLDDGCWRQWTDHYEWAHSVAPAGSRLPREQPPYTHWKPLGAPARAIDAARTGAAHE